MTLILNGTDNSATTPAVTGTDADTGVYYPAANQVALATGGTQAMLANASQGVQFANAIGVGATTPTTSGAGITFPATQSASTNANTLDDYEEGSWTPTLVSGASSFNPDAGNSKYTRIGNVVTCHTEFGVFTGTNGNTLTIGGLPFATGTGNEGTFSVMVNSVSYSGYLTGYLGSSSTQMLFYANVSGSSWGAIAGSATNASSAFIMTMTYIAS